jgi:hypothetical protein
MEIEIIKQSGKVKFQTKVQLDVVPRIGEMVSINLPTMNDSFPKEVVFRVKDVWHRTLHKEITVFLK